MVKVFFAAIALFLAACYLAGHNGDAAFADCMEAGKQSADTCLYYSYQ